MGKKDRMNQDYYIGLDIGTDSVGWAVTDTDYNLLKFKGEPMWGAHLFEAGKQAAERRSFRTARRRLDRRQQRVKLVQELFAEEIAKVDPKFFVRIKASALHQEDKKLIDDALADETNCIFSDENWGDREFHKKYPTIHHLIVDLMDLEDKGEYRDIRLYYLACAWFVAHRGHFLSEIDGDNIEKLTDIKPLYEDFMNWFTDRGFGKPWNCDAEIFGSVLNEKIRISDKEKKLAESIFGGKAPKDDAEKDVISKAALLKLFAGGETQVKKVFIGEEEFADNADKISMQMDEENLEAVLATLGDYAEMIVLMKRIYDCAILKDLQHGEQYISKAKVGVYEKHKTDLANLKHIIKTYKPEKYDDIFRNATENSYSAYVGNYKSAPSDAKLPKTAKRDDFYKNIKGILSTIKTDNLSDEDKSLLDSMLSDIDLGVFMPKQVNGDNRVIPKQLYYAEMKRVLEKASNQYSFLTKEDEDGLIASKKLLSIFNFRVPYFVGPLNEHSDHAWLERKAEGKILPWNIEDKVDYEKSEAAFINRMTNSCTYLPGKDVLPRWSLLYTRYTVLNEINNLTIDGKKISVDLKQSIYEDVFKKAKKVTLKALKNYLQCNVQGFGKDSVIGGIDININSSLKPWIEFRNLVDNKTLSTDDVERIISMSTYTEDKVRFRKWLSENYSLSEADLKYVSGLKYKDFGRLSEELLNGIEGTSNETGEIGTVMYFLWNTNDNLMQIIADSEKYTFAELIAEERKKAFSTKMSLNDRLDEMGISNAVKRPITRTLDVVKDIVKAQKHAPKKIFIEMARGATEEQKNKRTTSRHNQLLELYKEIKDDDSKQLTKELENLGVEANNKLQSQKLFLYFLQRGRCMYCGKSINLSDLSDNRYCDIDHIWPRSYVKDDSILNNKVLVHTEENAAKGDKYPIPKSLITLEGKQLWESLRKAKSNSFALLNDEKYSRLVRNTGFSENEKTGFINRQLVETQQSTKAIADIMKNKFGDSTEIVFVKASLVSEFRRDYGSIKEKALGLHLTDSDKKGLEMVKCRSINDIHHAKDAYLNIVAGNVYNTKFTKRFFDVSKDTYSLNNRIVFGTPTKDKTSWIPDKHVPIVEKTMSNNHAHLTKYQTIQKGALFDIQPVKASRNGLIPLKSSVVCSKKINLDPNKYGGYSGSKTALFVLVKCNINNKPQLIVLPVDKISCGDFFGNKSKADAYVQKHISNAKDIVFPLGKRLLKINTVISLDGFNICISGKHDESRITFRSLESCNYSKEIELYIKKVEKALEKIKNNKDYVLDEKHDGISVKNNNILFYELIGKINSSHFAKMPGGKESSP